MVFMIADRVLAQQFGDAAGLGRALAKFHNDLATQKLGDPGPTAHPIVLEIYYHHNNEFVVEKSPVNEFIDHGLKFEPPPPPPPLTLEEMKQEVLLALEMRRQQCISHGFMFKEHRFNAASVEMLMLLVQNAVSGSFSGRWRDADGRYLAVDHTDFKPMLAAAARLTLLANENEYTIMQRILAATTEQALKRIPIDTGWPS